MKKILCAVPLFLLLFATAPAKAQNYGLGIYNSCTAWVNGAIVDSTTLQGYCAGTIIEQQGSASVSMSTYCLNLMMPSVQLGVEAYNCTYNVEMNVGAETTIDLKDINGQTVGVGGVDSNGTVYWMAYTGQELWYGYNEEYCDQTGYEYYAPPFPC